LDQANVNRNILSRTVSVKEHINVTLIPESCGKRVVVKLTARSIARSITLTASSNQLPSAREEVGIPLKDMIRRVTKGKKGIKKEPLTNTLLRLCAITRTAAIRKSVWYILSLQKHGTKI
jgi:hypothetical protein